VYVHVCMCMCMCDGTTGLAGECVYVYVYVYVLCLSTDCVEIWGRGCKVMDHFLVLNFLFPCLPNRSGFLFLFFAYHLHLVFVPELLHQVLWPFDHYAVKGPEANVTGC